MHISPVHDVAWSTTVFSHRRFKLAGSASGFSLLELLVVIAIIGVLTTYIAPRFLGSVGKSEIQTARVQIDALSKAVESFRMDVGWYPSREEGLAALVEVPANAGVSAMAGPLPEGCRTA